MEAVVTSNGGGGALQHQHQHQHDEESVCSSSSSLPINNGNGKDEVIQYGEEPRLSFNMGNAEIDTAAPFESVKDAALMFGGFANWKARCSIALQKRELLERQLEGLEERVAVVKRCIVDTENETQQISHKAQEKKALAEKMAEKMKEHEMQEEESIVFENKAIGRKMQLETEKIKTALLHDDLKSIREEIEQSTSEYLSLAEARDNATEDAATTLISSENLYKQVNELSIELRTTKTFLDMAHHLYIETQERRRAEEKAKVFAQRVSWMHSKEGLEGNSKGNLSSYFMSEMDAKSPLLEILRSELLLIKEQEQIQRAELYSIEASISRELAELELLKQDEVNYFNSQMKISTELDTTREKLETSKRAVASLPSSVEDLREDLKKETAFLEETRQRVEWMQVEISLLKEELNNTQQELTCHQEEARQANAGLSELHRSLQQAGFDADKTKSEFEEARKDFKTAKDEAEQCNAAVRTLKFRIQASLKNAEVARVSEAMILDRTKALHQSELAVGYSEGNPSSVSLSLKEYNSLYNQAKQAEDFADLKVICTEAQIDVAERHKKEISKKLEEANQNLLMMKEALRVAQERESEAVEAKMRVEDQLRKRRSENCLRKKTGDLGAVSKRHGVSHHRTHSKKFYGHVHDDADNFNEKENIPVKKVQSLGQVMRMNASLQSKLGDDRLLDINVPSKKKLKLPRFSIHMVRKK